ncbi:uncharacterized protein PAC_16272 [Phialocephala subalpina]|uniref:Uncharacterized protein n=1 Tax=Phialocephala subalpina TaxID=576137 RepID=A0A1L7XMT4_9HELO|nr:uncharacterized protein PAC_16272 [Phialocephala subalpina]
MSVMYLDELSLFSVAAPRSPPTELSNLPPIELRNIHERSTIPAPVGILPLDHFIYILIGVLVFLCCSIALWTIFKAVKSPKRYYEAMRPEASAHVAAPYRSRNSPPPWRVNAKVKEEVRKLKDEPKYQGDGFLEPSLAAKPNLPIPVVMEIVDPEQPGTGMDSRDIEAWGNLVKERESLKMTIANLERLARARQQAGQQGSINPRLLAGRQRHAEVQNSINATYEKFRERRAEWSAEEWQVIELIMQHSP